MTNKGACETMPKFSDLLAGQKNAVIAALLGCDDSTASRIKHGDLGIRIGQVDALLEQLGMELVPRGSFHVPPDEWLMLKRMARRALDYDIEQVERMGRR